MELLTSIGLLAFLCAVVERIVAAMNTSTCFKRIPNWILSFVLGFTTLLFWRDIGILALVRPIDNLYYRLWDAFFTAWAITFGSGVFHDIVAFIQAKKETAQGTAAGVAVLKNMSTEDIQTIATKVLDDQQKGGT